MLEIHLQYFCNTIQLIIYRLLSLLTCFSKSDKKDEKNRKKCIFVCLEV